MTTRNPLDTVSRTVLIFPANEDSPRFAFMEFSQEGANHPHGYSSTTALNLRASYGKCINDTRVNPIVVSNQLERSLNGTYIVYFNVNVRLPINRSVARVVGVDPKHPGPKPFYRGDLFVVKKRDWPGQPVNIGGASHRIWLDCPTGMLGIVKKFLKDNVVNRMATLIEDEKMVRKIREEAAKDPLEPYTNPLSLQNWKYPFKDRTDRTITNLEKYRNKQIVREANRDSCTTCGIDDQSDLKVCAGCKAVKYCSRECQKTDWKNHKSQCTQGRA
ncbi:hypothetical protein CPB84DRAFT_1784053 [Gymnopilus junonius]|uniref:MYND-type domain-containing protein n=1 Tax=Gymnopilus junonius TaxID=109634 RepID=A0A9P5NKU5_GYMJU|nr:hypothetical protein CPB84DRAFT_1784053 [Gymnopilus junonius]